jgi:secondary thiamine-phosphate synthase enzyme
MASGETKGGLFQSPLSIGTRGQGLHEITSELQALIQRSGVQTGLCNLFVQHTSCSLVIQENADPTARADLEGWMARLAPEDDPRYTHTLEGSDDMPAHLRSAVTRTSEMIPIAQGRLGLGTWQGVFLWEHRRGSHQRQLIVTVVAGS